MNDNKAIAGMLRQIGALLDEQGIAFKPAAYRRAAQVVEELPHDIATYDGVEELKKLPSIGEGIGKKIVEYLDTGKMTALENLKISQGGIPGELLDIEDLGPKRVREFQMALGIQTVADLIQAAEKGKLRDLPRMSEEMEKKILENAKRVKERIKRYSLKEIKKGVEALMKDIKKVTGVEKAEVAGSYRREKETVGDIDILVVTKSPKKVADAITKLKFVKKVIAHGEKKVSFDMKSGLRVDVRFVKKDQWGSALLYFTGDKAHNIEMRKVAIKKNWKLNEYGLFEGEKVIASKTEKEIYEKLGLKYYEPKERVGGL